MQTIKLDDNAHLEFGFRIRSTQSSYRELEALLGAEAKVDWARTDTHPNRARFFAIPAEVDEDGRIQVPKKVVEAFTKYGGFLMIKLVTPQLAGQYANLAFYKKLWGFDKTQARRENGNYVYSMPIHGLEKAGEGRRFFFTLRITGDKDEAVLQVEKWVVTRGKEHFTVVKEKAYGPFPRTTVGHIKGIVRNLELVEDGNRTTPLRDLPIVEALTEYLDYLEYEPA